MPFVRRLLPVTVCQMVSVRTSVLECNPTCEVERHTEAVGVAFPVRGDATHQRRDQAHSAARSSSDVTVECPRSPRIWFLPSAHHVQLSTGSDLKELRSPLSRSARLFARSRWLSRLLASLPSGPPQSTALSRTQARGSTITVRSPGRLTTRQQVARRLPRVSA